MPAERLAAAAFPQHLLKHENMPVKSRSFHNTLRAAAAPLSSLNGVPRFPPQEEVGGCSPPAPCPLAALLMVGVLPRPALQRGELWLGASKGSKPGDRAGYKPK